MIVPKCVAKGPRVLVLLWGSGGGPVFAPRHESLWPCLFLRLQKVVTLGGRKGRVTLWQVWQLWHFVTFQHVS